MTTRRKIVYIGAPLPPTTRNVMMDNLPASFDLVFAEAQADKTLTAHAVAAVADADFLICWTVHLPGKVLETARRLKLIQKIGEGTDDIDVATAARLGIPVAKTAGSNSTSSAEMTTLLMLATLRRLPEAHASMVAGRWLKWEVRIGTGELRGKQVGIVGLGKIGMLVARQVQGFGCSVVYYRRHRLPESTEADLDVRFMPLDELLRTSDVVTLHIPLTPATRGLIGRPELALMKSTAILVNTSRGALVDEEALCDALKERRIRGAGLDAFAEEPPDPDHPLFSLPNVVLTPHVAGVTDDSTGELVRHAYANIVRVNSGEPLDPADTVGILD